MKLLCSLFGHKPRPWYEFNCHPTISVHPHYDGCLRAHRELTVECVRCGSNYILGKVIDQLLSGQDGRKYITELMEKQK